MPLALIAGASRGLGLALAEAYLAKGWDVIGTARGTERTALHGRAEASAGKLAVELLDVTDPDGIASLRRRLGGRQIDVLFANAGIMNVAHDTCATVSGEAFATLMLTNALGPMRVIEALHDLVPPGGVIGAMSSGLGSIANSNGTWELYSASKAALNMLMKGFASKHGDGRGTVVIAPGWVRTDMGGPGASLGVEDSIPGVIQVIESRAGKPGLAYLDYKGQTVPW